MFYAKSRKKIRTYSVRQLEPLRRIFDSLQAMLIVKSSTAGHKSRQTCSLYEIPPSSFLLFHRANPVNPVCKARPKRTNCRLVFPLPPPTTIQFPHRRIPFINNFKIAGAQLQGLIIGLNGFFMLAQIGQGRAQVIMCHLRIRIQLPCLEMEPLYFPNCPFLF